MSKLIVRLLFKGLGVLVPIALVIYLTYWTISGTERVVKGALTNFLPEDYYLPGMGIGVLIAGALFIGLLMYPWITRKLIRALETSIRKLPFLGTLYSSIRDVMELFDGGMKEKLVQPAWLDCPERTLKRLVF